ncbi:hypothetical protein DFH08DRAFT_882297 [Mycena albidolilacea]|uniref:Uncharacterized protein n=1 Tax=Mycena albidolilacea TaxID=1033008 RepID=A0AAD6ZNB1_9AGAR|nr:hypothetical protein DFH08DRAFT_882297 [Mycena albidolilacea]
MSFIYQEPKTRGGSYRSDLIVRTFGSHFRIVLKNDGSYGLPIGAMLLVAAAVECAVSLWKDGSLRTEGLGRKGKKSASGFIASPWASRGATYPLSIKSNQKWAAIYVRGSLSQRPKGQADDFISEASSTDDGEYVDPRTLPVMTRLESQTFSPRWQ